MSIKRSTQPREMIKSTQLRSQLADKPSVQLLDKIDRAWLGGQLRRGLDYVDHADELPETSWKNLLQAMVHKLRLEKSLSANAFVLNDAPRRFVGGTTGRSGTGWLIRNLGEHLPKSYSVMTEVGLFNFTQLRSAPCEYYYLSGNTTEGHNQYLEYFREFLFRFAYDSKKALWGGARGLRDLVPARALDICLAYLAMELNSAANLHDCYRTFGDFYCWLFNFHAVVSKGYPLWISKEPAYGRFAVDLFRLVPSSKLVILVRDGRDVALSMVQRGWHERTCDAMDRWRIFTEQTLKGVQALPDSFVMMVRYEDMTNCYETTIMKIFEFFELPKPSALVTGGKIGPIPGSIGRWRTELSTDDLAYFRETCSTLAADLGYDI